VLHPERASDDWRGPTTYQRYQVYAAVCCLKGVPPKPFMYTSQVVDPSAAERKNFDALSCGMGMDLQAVRDEPPQRATVARPPAAHAHGVRSSIPRERTSVARPHVAQMRNAPNNIPTERPVARPHFAMSADSSGFAPAVSTMPSRSARARPVVVQHPTLLRVPSPIRRASPVSVAHSVHHVHGAVRRAATRSAAPRVVLVPEQHKSRAPAVVHQPVGLSRPIAARRAGERREEKKHVREGSVDAVCDAAMLSSDGVAAAHVEHVAVPMGFAWGWSSMYGTSLSCTLA
jgi:hypothetical protein